jgi:L-rhamnose 1-dehydrogenase
MTTFLLQGKAAAITGAVTGIGRAIALGYLAQGASVAVNHLGDAVSEKHWENLKAEAGVGDDRLIAVAGDISQPETGERLIKECVRVFGKVDIFVSNAGVCVFGEFLE